MGDKAKQAPACFEKSAWSYQNQKPAFRWVF